MKFFAASALALITLSACSTTKIVEKEVPVTQYLTIHPEKPDLTLETVEWLYLPDQELLALTPEQFDTYNRNNVAIETYILKLIEGWKYYERSTKRPDERDESGSDGGTISP